jgi:hypothetical protein
MILQTSSSTPVSYHSLDSTPTRRVISPSFSSSAGNASAGASSRTPSRASSSSEVSDSAETTRSNNAEQQRQQAAQRAQQQAEQKMIQELQARDREVRTHEQAHVTAGGSLVISGPSYTYQRGPDGRAYAIGGKVQLDVSEVANDPEASLQKSEQIRRAALAPMDPSPQDMKVAASAGQMAARARLDIAVQRREEAQLETEQRALEAEQQRSEQIDSEQQGDSALSGMPSIVNPAEATDPMSSTPPSTSVQSVSDVPAAFNSVVTSSQSATDTGRLSQYA